MTYNEEFVTGNQCTFSQSPESTTEKNETHSGTSEDEQENKIDFRSTDAEECVHACHSNGEEGETGVEARLLQTLGEAACGGICGGRSVEWVKGTCEGEEDCT